MRVIHLLATWPEPSETFLRREVDALRAAGVEVRQVALRPGAGGPDPLVEYPSRDWWPTGSTLARLPAALAGLTELVRESPRLATTARWLPAAGWLAELASAWRADLLHAAWSNLPARVAYLAERLGGPPYTIAGHARDIFCPGAAGSSLTAWRACRGFTVCHRAALREVRRLAPELGERLVWLPHGLPLDEWTWRGPEPPGPPVVLAVGRLVAKKGWDTLLAAVEQLPGLRLKLLGDGPERARLMALARPLGARVEWLGQVPEARVARELRAATILALPSRVAGGGDKDGLANVLLEALAVGVPVLTTRAGSATDVIVDGRTGLLVPPDDPATLARGLARLLADKALRRRLASAGRQAVERRFDARRTGARLAAWLRAAATIEDGS